MPNVSVCLSTDLIKHHGELSEKQVVIIDILRATTCMLTAFIEGAELIKAFDDLEKCFEMRKKSYLVAGERNGEKVDDFDLGNSPFDYMGIGVKDRKIAMTTTNGTKALIKSTSAKSIYIGSFLNITSLSETLKDNESDVLLFCAGWKGRPNSEDSLFAGMLVSNLIKGNFDLEGDEALMCLDFYKSNENNIYKVIESSAHAIRLLAHTDISKDLEFCSLIDKCTLVPFYKNEEIKCD